MKRADDKSRPGLLTKRQVSFYPMRILRHGSIYDSILREILIKKHVCIRTSFPQRVKKALIKRKYENMLREKGLLHFRIIPPQAIEYEEFAKKATEMSHELNQLKQEEKFILDITLEVPEKEIKS